LPNKEFWRIYFGGQVEVCGTTFCHKDVYFITGSRKDAVTFQDTVQKLARHVSTTAGRKQGPMLGKAMEDLET
jgi:hypothetical protein